MKAEVGGRFRLSRQKEAARGCGRIQFSSATDLCHHYIFKVGVSQKLFVCPLVTMGADRFSDRVLDDRIVSGLDRSVQDSCPPGPRSRPNLNLSPTTSKALTQPPKTC